MFIKTGSSLVGKQVRLTVRKESCQGYFEEGSIVTIIAEDPRRGYSFQDIEGNQITESGFKGFVVL